MGARLRINPVFVFLSVLFWSWLWGIAGAFVAVPLLLALRAASQRSRRLRLVRVFLDPDSPAMPLRRFLPDRHATVPAPLGRAAHRDP